MTDTLPLIAVVMQRRRHLRVVGPAEPPPQVAVGQEGWAENRAQGEAAEEGKRRRDSAPTVGLCLMGCLSIAFAVAMAFADGCSQAEEDRDEPLAGQPAQARGGPR